MPDPIGRVPQLECDVASLKRRMQRLEDDHLLLVGLLSPEQHAQFKLIKQAERIVDIARAEGMLPPL